MSATQLFTQLNRASLQQRRGATSRRSSRLCVAARLVLTPTGDGTTAHIGEEVAPPTTIELKDGLFELGRAAPADIVIGIPTVSTRHCMLRVSEADSAGVIVTDLGSTNGTFVDGKELAPMQATPLAVGSQVVFGDQYLASFRLDSIPDAPAPAAEEAPAAAPAQE